MRYGIQYVFKSNRQAKPQERTKGQWKYDQADFIENTFSKNKKKYIESPKQQIRYSFQERICEPGVGKSKLPRMQHKTTSSKTHITAPQKKMIEGKNRNCKSSRVDDRHKSSDVGSTMNLNTIKIIRKNSHLHTLSWNYKTRKTNRPS